MSWVSNPYYDPEKVGLKKVAEFDFSDGYYQFDLTAVWTKEGQKKFFWADDSGCSCPSPFEGIHAIEQLQSGPFKEVRNHLNSRFDAYGTYVKLVELHPALEKLHAISSEWEDASAN